MLGQTIGYVCISMIILYAIRYVYQYIQQSYTTPKTVNLVKIYEQKYSRLLEDLYPLSHAASAPAHAHAPVDTHIETSDNFQQSMRDSLSQLVHESDKHYRNNL